MPETRSGVPTPLRCRIFQLLSYVHPCAQDPAATAQRSQGAPSAPSSSFTLSLRDEAAHVPVTLRASFADRTLAWISPWGCKKLISAPFLFYPKRFFEVSENQVARSLRGGAQSGIPMGRQGCILGIGGQRVWGWETRARQEKQTSTPRLSTLPAAASDPTPKTWI